MPKSKYPQKLDSSVEIPPVRDNVLEVGSDAINSLRSAIFNIERVLGINPQGAAGNTVSERISKSLDGNGNIKAEALDRTNILTGPIIDADVSRVASIQESKLKLDFPTTLLQDEISILNTSINTLIEQAEELSTAFSIHTNANALNRHPATSISVTSHNSIGSDISAQDIEFGSVQSTFENVFDGHIKYTGIGISSDNNSHLAEQIYFDNSGISSIISADDVQNAIVDLSSAALNSQVNHQQLQHSNGILKIGDIDSATNGQVGNILAEDVSISFSSSNGESSGLTLIHVNDILELGNFNLERSDILTISDDSDLNLQLTGEYEIESFTLAGNNIDTITIYGTFKIDSTSLTFGRISKNIRADTNHASLVAAVREEANLTSARSIQVCNPNSVKVISSGIRPMEITTSNRFINVAIDGGTAVSIDLYNGDVSKQSIDSIISRFNEQCSEKAYSFLAYRIDYSDRGSEMTIAHNLPDEEGDQHTITISRSSDSGIDAAGFASIEDAEISSEFGTNYYINGTPYEGLNVVLDSTDLNFLSSALVINSSSSGLDFLQIGVKIDNLIIITDSADPTDDGTYVIKGVSETQLTLDSGQLPSGFTDSSQDSTRFRIYSNIASFGSLVFCEVTSTLGSVLSDVFLSKDRKVFSDKRFEYSAKILGSTPLITLVDFRGDIAEQEFKLDIVGGTDLITLSLDGGESINLRGDNNYIWIKSGARNVSLKFMIPSVSDVNTEIISSGNDITMSFFGFEGVNSDSNMLISRVAFDNFSGRVNGGAQTPRVFPIAHKGNISINEISDDVDYFLSRRPIDELRTNGVICGLEVTNAIATSDLFTFDLSSGVCYVNGKRIKIEAQTAIITDIYSTTIDKIFIAITEDGTIKVESATSTCDTSVLMSENCLLASIEFNGATFFAVDLRLFINDLDLKLLNSITVSPQPGMGHFSEFGKAIKYAKRFSQIFSNAGTPTIHLKSGTFNINLTFDKSSITFADYLALPTSTILTEYYDTAIIEGLIIDFPVNIIGEGDSSVLSIRNSYTFSDVSYDFRGVLTVPGGGFLTHTNPLDPFNSGFIMMKDFKMDNCKIGAPDLIINDGVEDLIFGIDLDSITFDFRNFTTNPIDASLGSIMISLSEIDDKISNKGNFSARNCNFIVDSSASSEFLIKIGSASRFKNLNFTNNKIMNANGSNSIALFNKDIFTFEEADSGSNIEISGNIATSSLSAYSASRSRIIYGVNGWGDRTSRSLSIGKSVRAESHSYNEAQTKTRIYTFDRQTPISSSAVWTTGFTGGTYTTSSLVSLDGTTTWPIISLEPLEQFRMQIDLNPGEKIVGVTLGVNEDPALSTTWTGNIESGDRTGGSVSTNMFEVEEFGIRNGSLATNNIDTLALFSSSSGGATTVFDVTGLSSKLYFIRVFHNSPTDTNSLYWIEITYEVDNVESAIGLT